MLLAFSMVVAVKDLAANFSLSYSTIQILPVLWIYKTEIY